MTDGSVNGKCYFICDDHCGEFVAINEIVFSDIDTVASNTKLNDVHSDMMLVSHTPWCDDLSDQELLLRPLLEIGERVVWINDSGPELGTVLWIGILPDGRIKEYTVGVEFDNPIGTGTGKYNNKQLFRTRQNHASLIPALGLMKAVEFYGSTSFVPPAQYDLMSQDLSPSNNSNNDQLLSHLPKLDEFESCQLVDSKALVSTRVNKMEHFDKLPEDLMDQGVRSENDVSVRQNLTTTADMTKDIHVHMSNEPILAVVGRHGDALIPSDYRPVGETTNSERSIYDHESEHCYENMEKDESGRLLNRDTLAFCTGDSVSELPEKCSSWLSNSGNDKVSYHLYNQVPTSSQRASPSVDAVNNKAAVMHCSAQSVDNIFSDGKSHHRLGETVPATTFVFSSSDLPLDQQVPYRTGRSTFYQRVDNIDGKGKSTSVHPVCHSPVAETTASNTDGTVNCSKASKSGSVFVGPGVTPVLTNDHMSSSNDQIRSGLSSEALLQSVNYSTIDYSNTASHRMFSELLLKNIPNETDLTGKEACPSIRLVPKPLSRPELTDTDLGIGSMVQFEIRSIQHYGVIRWIGFTTDKNDPIAGIELEEESSDAAEGVLCHTELFTCAPNKGYFEHLYNIKKDQRFTESSKFVHRMPNQLFGSIECVNVPGIVSLPSFDPALLGQNHGIQGHHNSCYMDATLFGMFAFSMVFDTILYRPFRPMDDIEGYDEVQAALRDGIVNPLRKNFYVRADKILHLRQLLDKSSSVQGLMSEEKDPEEFLNSLLQQTLKADPFIHLSSGQDSYFYQLFMDKDDCVHLPTTQQLLELSFLQSDVKLSEIPSCLILQMPRFGREYKMFRRIVPSLFLDITDILQHGIRECAICGMLATYECKNCFREFGEGLNKIAFCDICIAKSHSRNKRFNHQPVKLPTNPDYKKCTSYSMSCHQTDRLTSVEITSLREKMELFAVICIQTSHYVAFVKTGTGNSVPWVFFDSMADRKGEQHGYNVPKVDRCQYLPFWLDDESYFEIHRHHEDRDLPEQMRRLLCDAYICMYQTCSLAEYR